MKSKSADAIVKDTVVVSVVIAAEVATVWSYFTDPARFAAWIGAYAGQGGATEVRIDPRVGGEIRVGYPGGAIGLGKVTALEPQQRFAFSWGYEGGAQGLAPGSTQVEIALTQTAEGTLVELRHSGIPNDTVRRGHLAGWKHYLSMLAKNAADAQFGAGLPERFDAYFRAWREADDAARAALLMTCCESTVRVRTGFACTDGIEELSAHIANGLKHMPGMSLVADGAPQQLHGYARANWAVQMPDGKPAFRGTNFMVFSPQGKIAAVVSFPAG